MRLVGVEAQRDAITDAEPGLADLVGHHDRAVGEPHMRQRAVAEPLEYVDDAVGVALTGGTNLHRFGANAERRRALGGDGVDARSHREIVAEANLKAFGPHCRAAAMSRKFIGGEPMKPATKRWPARS